MWQDSAVTPRHVASLYCSAFALLAICCGADGGAGTPSPTIDSGPACNSISCLNECQPGTETRISGRVFAPNGVDPIPDAWVYVARQIRDFPAGVSCEICRSIEDSALVSTVSAVDGSFELGPLPTRLDQAPGETVQLVLQKGRFRRVVDVPIASPCGTNQLAPALSALPGKNDGPNTVPKIAVVSGDYDEMECVLLNLGLEPEAVHMWNGFGSNGTPNAEGRFDDLLRSQSKMKEYNIIFINCSANHFESLLQDAEVRGHIADYVSSGGRLYVTDWAYDYIEQVETFSPLLDFAPTPSDDAPEALNAAAVGTGGIAIDALVHNPKLREWLEAVEVVTGEELISADGRVRIEHFLDEWAVQLAAAPVENVTTWLSGDVIYDGMPQTLPLTTTFDQNDCGRALYTSYHTEGRNFLDLDREFPLYCDAGGLSPQERVLMFLILHVADCIDVEID